MTEHEKNLGRAKVWKLVPYSGDFLEIDLKQDWYCPHCRDGSKLILSNAGDCLLCPTEWHACEYEYHNAAGRDKYEVFWSKGFKYPLSHQGLLIDKRDCLITGLSDNKAQITRLRKRNKEIELEIQSFNDELKARGDDAVLV